MKVTLLVVGKLKEAHFRDAAAEYVKRLKPYTSVEVVEVPDRDLTHDESRAIAEEGRALLSAFPERAHVIALDARGKQMTSEEFAEHLEELGLRGTSHVAFVVGGAAGLSDEVLDAASVRLSLGKMTFPHQMIRVMLLEQVYRAFRIMRGEPYHR